MLKKCLLIIIALACQKAFGQDVQFSQLFVDRTWLNPAYAGIDYCPRVSLLHRNQWPGIQFPYTTYNFTVEKYSESLQGGVGLRLMSDEQGGGVFKLFSVGMIYAYQARLSRKMTLRLAMEASFYQKSQNYRDLVFYSMIDPAQGVIYPNSENLIQENFQSPDFSFGILFRHTNYFAGISAAHIPHHIVAEHNDYLPLKITAHVGATLPIDKNDKKKEKLIIEPNLVLINQQNSYMLFYGMYFDIKKISSGLFFRHDLGLHYDALILSNYLNFNKLSIGYSFDITLSKFIRHTWGSHEISILYIFACDKKIKNYNTISCPSF